MKRYLAAVLLPLFWLAAATPSDAAALSRSDFFFKSIISVDSSKHTVTLPLHRGSVRGKSVWFIVTDASNAQTAKSLGVAYAALLASLDSSAVAHASKGYAFAGAPDFSPARRYVASATGFPPASAVPGATSSNDYSPFVTVDGIAGVLNAPIVATGDGPFDVTTHSNTQDRVIAIDTKARTVTLILAQGFFNDRPVYYLSTEASDPIAATVERATYVPRLKGVTSGVIPIGVVANGPRDAKHHQGLAFLTLNTPIGSDATAANAIFIGSPFNVLSLVPNKADPYAHNGYSPLWNAIVAGGAQSKQLTSFAAVAALAKPAGFVVNCPAIAYGDEHEGSY